MKPLTNTIDEQWVAEYEAVEFEQFLMQYRPPTVAEAVDSIMRCVLKSTRQQQLQWFKTHYGDQFAKEVEILVKQKWKKK